MIWFLLSLSLFLFYGILKTKQALIILEQNKYNENKYLKWIKSNLKDVFLSFDLLFLIFLFVGNIRYKNIITIFILLYMFSFLILNKKIIKSKKTLNINKKVKSLSIITFLIYFVIVFILCLNFNYRNANVYYLILGFTMYLQYIIIYIVNVITKSIGKIICKN